MIAHSCCPGICLWSVENTCRKHIGVIIASVCPVLPFWFMLLCVLEVSETEVVLVPIYFTVLPGVFCDFVYCFFNQFLFFTSATSWGSKHRIFQSNVAFNMISMVWNQGETWLGLVEELSCSHQITTEFHLFHSTLWLLKWTLYPAIT